MQSDFRLSHIPALNGIRGFAILAVVLFHSAFLPSGYFGVDVFFVLSGFLITSLIIREWMTTGEVRLKHFYIRRALRLGPALIVVLIAACIYESFYRPYPGVESIFVRSFYALFYVANWAWALQPDPQPLGSLLALWSLSIEEQFYLIWPVTLVLLLRRRMRLSYIGLFLFLLILASVAHRYFLWEAGAHPFRLYAGTDSHADPILIGCLLAIAAHGISSGAWRSVRPWLAAIAPFAAIGLLLMAVLFNYPSESVFYVTGVGFLTGLLILSVTVAPAWIALTIFECPVFVWLGKISYSLYLWHSISSMYLATHELVDYRLLRIAIGLGLAVGSYYLIERPVLRMGSLRFNHHAVKTALVRPFNAAVLET
jgi:peptidoglycan/LPS O-acetylase OafA/YrhL